jgi:hypothetical protein
MNRHSLRIFLLLLLGATWLHAQPAILDSPTFHKSDTAFFFDSISYDHGEWRFGLSRNAMGMLWRTIDGKEDVTGVCNYRQTLVVSKSASLEIKTRDFSVFFRPRNLEGPVGQASLDYQAGYWVWKRMGPSQRSLGERDSDLIRASQVVAREDGRIEISSWDD